MLVGARTGIWSGGAYEVEWLQNDIERNGYFDSGVIGSEKIGFSINFDFIPQEPPNISSNGFPLWARVAYLNRGYYVNFGNNGGIGIGNQTPVFLAESLSIPKSCSASYNSATKAVYFNGLTGTYTGVSFTTNGSVAIFGVNNNDVFRAQEQIFRIKGRIRFTDESGNPVVTLVPMCRGGVGMYFDEVSGRWIEPQRGGVFICGPKV